VTDCPELIVVGLADAVVVVAADVTVSVLIDEVLVANPVTPSYRAVMLYGPPTGSVVVLNVAVPLLSVPVPIVVAPRRKVTVPPSGTEPGVTVAVNVTF